MIKRFWLSGGSLGTIVLSTLLLQATDASAQGTAAGPPPPSCTLLRQAEAEEILGKPIKPLGPLEFGPRTCAYTPVGEANAVVTIAYGAGYASAEEFYRAMEERARQAGEKLERMAGVGEGALYTPSDGLMWVYNRRRAALISAPTDELALAVARKVVTRLTLP
jgi:hypothetical protein